MLGEVAMDPVVVHEALSLIVSAAVVIVLGLPIIKALFGDQAPNAALSRGGGQELRRVRNGTSAAHPGRCQATALRAISSR
jgi:hypothetical protein